MVVRHVFEAGGYYVRCRGEFDEAKQQWRPVIWFERVADYSKSLVPSMQHKLVVWFDTQAEAAKVAEEQFPGLIARNEVGL